MARVKPNGELPLDLQQVPEGFVREVYQWIHDTSPCPQPRFALGAALVLAGTLFGRHFKDESGQRTNLYALLSGPSSSGKDHPLKSVAHALDSCEASNLRRGRFCSDSALEYSLRSNPRVCLCIDEAAFFIAEVKAAGRGNSSSLVTVKPTLLELWSSADSRWVGKLRVPKSEDDNGPAIVDCPHVCMIGTAQPEVIWPAMSPADISDGFLGRLLVFSSPTRPMPRQIVQENVVPSAIRTQVLTYRNEPAAGVPVMVRADDEARKMFEEFGRFVHDMQDKGDRYGDMTLRLWGKAPENARRVALILAAARYGKDNPVIEQEHAEYACSLVKFLVGGLVKTVRENVSENRNEAAKKRIIAIVRSFPEGVTKAKLTKKSQWLNMVQRNGYLAELIESGQLVVRRSNSGADVYNLGR